MAQAGPQRNPEALLRRVEWTVIRRLDGLLHGDYRTLFRGFGLDLADLREYQYGDDVRHIDWNVTARLQTPYVREYHEDREITAWFLLDLSRSIDFGSQDVKGHRLGRLRRPAGAASHTARQSRRRDPLRQRCRSRDHPAHRAAAGARPAARDDDARAAACGKGHRSRHAA